MYKQLLLVTLLGFISCKSIAQSNVPSYTGYSGDLRDLESSEANILRKEATKKSIESLKTEHFEDQNYTLKVKLKDGTTLKCTSRIFINDSCSYVINEKNSDKIYSKQTASIFCSNIVENIEGIPTDSCWLFKSIKGKISAYTAYPSKPKYSTDYILYIQKGNGPLVKYSHKILYRFISDNKFATKFFLKQKFIAAINAYNGQ